jgi:hypothetical protein
VSTRPNRVSAQSWAIHGECWMTEYDPDSLPFESSEQESARLREENACLRRLLSTHGIAIPQWTPATIPSPDKVAESMKVDREERARKRIALFRSQEAAPRDGGRAGLSSRGRNEGDSGYRKLHQ